MFLVGDIGGTKTVLAMVSEDRGARVHVAERRFRSRDYDSLERITDAFLEPEGGPKLLAACFGVAGPVVGQRAEITNLPWVIDSRGLSDALGGIPVHLMNDLEAVASSLPVLAAEDLHPLKNGDAIEQGAKAVIAPGTGLGEAFAVWDGDRYRACPSEGGHASFAPRDGLQIELLSYLSERFEHVSFERVCSGGGLPNIYAFLKDTGRAVEPEWLADKITAVDDPTPIIVEAGLDESVACEICQLALGVFVSMLGAEAGNLALKVLATGGVYLGGGITPRILPLLEKPVFAEAFTRKGRQTDVMERIPVHAIVHPLPGLLGAATYALEQAAREKA